MKKLISLLLSIVLLFEVGAEAFAAYTEYRAKAYESSGCTITYTIQNEWDGNQQISMSITNNGSETVRNWALKFDGTGEITNIWNAGVCKNDGEIIALRNSGYNYEIIPNGTVEFGFQLRGDDLRLPESVTLCNKTVDVTDDTEISFNIQNSWDDGFIAEVSVTNNSDEPLEAWRLSFNGNFEITNFWNANKLYSEDGFLFENNVSTMPIAKGETKTFGFQGTITPGETPEMSDFIMTSIVIDLESEQPTDPDKPIDPDKPDDPIKSKNHTILCFGQYNDENKAIEIFWKSTDNGTVTICESTDGSDWNRVAEISDGNSYIYGIAEEFFTKQIKVNQETANGTIESDPFMASYTKDGFAITWLDSDQDGIPDYLEKIYGTNPDNSDTDCDGLTDYEEILLVGTDPLKYDTNENGANDGEDDIDRDGLSNKEELNHKTSVSNADTDKDGLSDYDEIYVYGTNPLNADNDGDTLNDGDEIVIGLDPSDPKTFGIPDAEYKIKQTISSDSKVLENINTEESPYEVSLEIFASGNAASQLIANQSAYSAVTESSARLGGAVDFSYLSGEVDKVKLTYKIAYEYISNENSEYAEKCLDLQGIKRYNIFRYFEDLNMLLPVTTEFDEENNTLFAETDELGTYCVLDMTILMQNLGIELEDGITTETVERIAYSAVVYSEEDNTKEVTDGDYNIIFIIDNRSTVISKEQFNSIKEQILEFAGTIVTEKRDFKITVYNQSASDFTKSCCKLGGSFEPKEHDYESTGGLSGFIGKLSSSHSDIVELLGENCIISDGLTEAINSCGSDTRNYIFDIYAQENAVYDSKCSDSIQSAALENKVNISIISDTDLLTGFQSKLADSTNGIVLNYNEGFVGKVYKHIFNEEYVQKKIPEYKYGMDFDAVLATGLQKVFLNSELYPNGKNPSGEDTDTDMDGLTDWDEVDFAHWAELGLITYDEKHNVILPTIGQCAKHTEKSYVYEGLKRLEERSDYATKLLNTRVMPISSDPTNSDGDGDNLLDSFEYSIHTDPLKADTDDDGLRDDFEYVYGTNPKKPDSDYDGLNDKYEIDNGLDPLNSDTDGDGIWDGDDPNPLDFDKKWEDTFIDWVGYVCDFVDGVIRGDFIRNPNLPQLMGIITGNFIPLIDIRDVIANLCYGDFLFAGLSAVGLIPAYGDAAKLVSKVSDFIIANAKNADNIIGIMKFTQKIFPSLFNKLTHSDECVNAIKLLSHSELLDLFANQPAIRKALNIAISSGGSTDEVIDVFKRFDVDDTLHFFDKFVINTDAASIAKYERDYSNILKSVSGHEDEIISLMAKVTDPQAARILNLSSKYGEVALSALKTCGPENIDTISLIIRESKISDEAATNFLKASSNYGDALLGAVNKCGIENVDRLTNLVLRYNGENAAVILDLARKYDSATAAKFLDTMINHGDTMIKVISKYPNLPAKAIEDYSKIFKTFGSNADEIINKNTVNEFIGLDKALHAEHSKMVCFTTQDDLCIVTVSDIEFHNPTITSFDNYIDPKFIHRTDDAARKYFRKQYDDMFTEQYVDNLEKNHRFSSIEKENQSIANEYRKLINAIERTRDAAPPEKLDKLGKRTFTNYPVTNCAEVWGAREMILKGYMFDDIKKHLFAFQLEDGLIRIACENCQHTFDLLN